jgi:hypothetical protein
MKRTLFFLGLMACLSEQRLNFFSFHSPASVVYFDAPIFDFGGFSGRTLRAIPPRKSR